MNAVAEQRMTFQHTEALLALLVSLDPRLRATDASTAALRTNAWTSLLGEVDPAYAVKYAELAYQEVRDFPLTPAEILVAWRTEARETAQQAGEALFAGDTYQQVSHGWPAEMADWVRNVVTTIRHGGDGSEVPRPQNRQRQLTVAQDAWRRRCAFHRICACDHTVCRDGWLDEVTEEPGPFGDYEKVTRCPHCADALAMAVEQGIAKRPSFRPRRRS